MSSDTEKGIESHELDGLPAFYSLREKVCAGHPTVLLSQLAFLRRNSYRGGR
jgi:hypothetical protein